MVQLTHTNAHISSGVVNSSNDSDDEASHSLPHDLVHILQHDKSILALVVSSKSIFAGTEGGEILVYDLETFRTRSTIHAHDGSVLGLFLSPDEKLLFSCGADHFVNVWNAENLASLYTIYSTYDIGDVFCAAYSSRLNTLYFGAQNASIQWYDLKEKHLNHHDPINHPRFKQDKFFDSKGPGGSITPKPHGFGTPSLSPTRECLQINRHYIKNFAHYGYVYTMLIVEDITSDQNEEVLITGGGDGIIKVWTLHDSGDDRIEELYTLGTEEDERESVLTLVLEGTFLISGHIEGDVNIWDLDTKQLVRTLKTSVLDVITVSVGGSHLFVGGANGKVEQYDSQYELVETFEAHKGRILASASTNFNGTPLLITGANDNAIKIWDVQDCLSSQVLSVTSNEKLVDRLRAFVGHKTISSDPRFHAECLRGASFLRAVLREFGAYTELLVSENGDLNPVVYGLFKGRESPKNKARILFYGHYDVIRAEKGVGKWKTDPFHMEGINEYLYGRGTSDNKGPLLAAIYAVAELIAEKSLESDIIFLVEGEEECGSREFENLIRRHKEQIGHVDWILLANSYWLDDYVPCLTYGLRGVIHATVEVTSEHPDLHSGVDGSSLMDEALKDLVVLLSTLIGKKGKVNLPEFYDPVLPITKSETLLYQDITKVLIDPGATEEEELSLTKKLQQKWREASLTIHRFNTSGPENSTIIPRKAKAAISLRLVPNQEAEKIADDLVEYLHDQFGRLDTTNSLKVIIDHKAEPWLGDFNNEMYKILEEGIHQAWYSSPHVQSGQIARPSSPQADTTVFSQIPPHRPLYIREGGSIPAIRFLEKEFGAPAAHLPCGQASDNAHLDNERLRLVNLYKSRDVFKWVFSELPKRDGE